MEGLQLDRSPRSRLRPHGVIGWGAGILALGVLLGVTAGAVWGLYRPAYFVVVKDGAPHVDAAASPDNVEFVSFAWFVMLTCAIGLVLGLAAYCSAPRRGSVWRMLFTIAVAIFASWSLYVFGSWSAELVNNAPPAHGLAAGDSISEGATFEIVPMLRPGVAWLASPFVALLTYWIGLLYSAMLDSRPVDGRGPGELNGKIVEYSQQRS